MDVDLEELNDLWSSVPREDVRRIADLARRSLCATTASIRSFEGGADVLRYTSRHTDQNGETSRPAPTSREVADGDVPAESRLDAPISLRSGFPIGTLSVFDEAARVWSNEDRASLRDLAGCLADRIPLSSLVGKPIGFGDDLALLDRLPALLFESRNASAPDETGAPDETVQWFGSAKAALPVMRQILASGPDSMLDLVHSDDRQRVGAALRRGASDGGDVDLLFRLSDTPTRWLRAQSVVRRDENGGIVRSGICCDVTDVVAARDGADKRAVVDVNHELRTPLQAIIGFTEFLKRETRPDAIASHANTIQSAAESLLSIVNKTLDVAGNGADVPRSTTGEAVVLQSFAETCMSLVAPLILEKRLASSVTIDADVPAEAILDRQRVQQALLNLLNNAVKFTDAGEVALHVSRVESGVRFSVSDTGIGIPSEKRALLFQRFSRIESSDRATGGSGLGLSITKTLVESLGGDIGVDTREGGGTTFWFAVPVGHKTMSRQPEAGLARAPSRIEIARDEDDLSPVDSSHILLADDLDLNRKLICDMLTLEGHVVDSVADGAAAVKAAGENPYDLILMDMIMPGMDGIEATRAIRALPSPACEVPIVALTAHSFREQLDSCIQAGMDATLTKPMSLDALTSAVATWTRRRRKAA